MKHLFLLLAITVTFSSCTVWTGPVKLADSGEKAKASPRIEQLPPPESTGELTLAFEGVFAPEVNLLSPQGISFGVDGTLYVCDREHSSIVRLGEDGALIARFSGYSSRVARLYSPIDVCSTSGMGIYVVDAANSQILRFDRNLKNNFVAYSKDSDATKLFGSFSGLSFDRGSGDLYVTDRDTGSLIRIDMLRKAISSRGSFGSGRESLKEPLGIDVTDDGAIFIADRAAGSIATLHHYGTKINSVGGGILEGPVDVVSIPDGRLAIADKRGILILSADGAVLATAGFGADRSMEPRSIAYREDKLYVSDGVSRTILVYSVK